MADLNQIMEWTFISETTVPKEVQKILINGEAVEVAYRTLKDIAVITNKRIIISNKQGLTGKKNELYTIPFKSVVMYSSESTGSVVDFNVELELWTKVGNFKINLKKGIDISKLDRIIGTHVL